MSETLRRLYIGWLKTEPDKFKWMSGIKIPDALVIAIVKLGRDEWNEPTITTDTFTFRERNGT